MNFALIMQIGMGIIQALPTIEASVAAAQQLVSHIHSFGDAAQAGSAVVQNLPALLDAVLANTPQGAPASNAEASPVTLPRAVS